MRNREKRKEVGEGRGARTHSRTHTRKRTCTHARTHTHTHTHAHTLTHTRTHMHTRTHKRTHAHTHTHTHTHCLQFSPLTAMCVCNGFVRQTVLTTGAVRVFVRRYLNGGSIFISICLSFHRVEQVRLQPLTAWGHCFNLPRRLYRQNVFFRSDLHEHQGRAHQRDETCQRRC